MKTNLSQFVFKLILNWIVLFFQIQDQGVDPNLRDGDGATPLHFAASRGHLETVRWLLKHGARLSLDKYGKSPINDAAENQQVEVSVPTNQAILDFNCQMMTFTFCSSCPSFSIQWLWPAFGQAWLVLLYGFTANLLILQCLNVLVQHGTTPDYGESKHGCSCIRKDQQVKRVSWDDNKINTN